MRNLLTNVLGAREDADIEVSERHLRPGTVLLLCTGGVQEVVDDERLCALFTENEPGEQVMGALLEDALSRGAHDNVAAVLVCAQKETAT